MRNGPTLIGAPKLNRVTIGGGGFVTCVDTCPVNGRVIIGCDTSPAQWRDLAGGPGGARFIDCLSTANTAGLGIDIRGATYGSNVTGASGVAIAPSNPAVMMIVTCGYVLRTTDSWATVTKCNIAPFTMDANGGLPRTWNPRLAIHPTDPNTFIFGTQIGGAYYSTDGGATVTSTGIGAGALWHFSTTPNLVCFDPTAPANVYVCKNGTGVYRSTTGVSGTFTLLSGGPANPSSLHVTADGTLFVTDINSDYGMAQNLWKLARGSTSWVHLTMPAGGGTSITSDPSNANRLFMGYNDASSQYFSLDAGVTWTHVDNISIDGTTSGLTWIETSTWYFTAQLKFNSFDGKIYRVHGTGVCRITPPTSTSTTSLVWEDYSLGSEMLGVLDIVSTQGNEPIVRVYDKAMMRPHNLRSPDARATVPGVADGGTVVTHCFSMDYEPGNPQHLVSLTDFGGWFNGYSNNGGDGFWPQFVSPAHPDSSHTQVLFSGLTGNFVNGATITGGTSGAQGTLAIPQYKYGGVSTQTSGVLLLSNVTGTFTIGETITGVGGGSASVAANGDGNSQVTPSPLGGMICRTGPTQMIWCPGNEGRVVRTTDFGATWIDLTIGGLTPIMAQNNSQWLDRRNFASDKERPGHVAFIGRNEGAPTGGLPLAAVWHSADHGATWTKKCDAHPLDPNGDSQQFGGCRLTYVPGHAGKLLFTDGGTSTNQLLTSDDDGATWTRLGTAADVHSVWQLSFGKGLPGSQWPAVVFSGACGSTGGSFVSYDMFATAPLPVLTGADYWYLGYSCVSGDMNVLGRIWAGLYAGGLAYYDFKDVRALT